MTSEPTPTDDVRREMAINSAILSGLREGREQLDRALRENPELPRMTPEEAEPFIGAIVHTKLAAAGLLASHRAPERPWTGSYPEISEATSR
jgi:hypothetical protein